MLLGFFLGAMLGHIEFFEQLYRMDLEGPELLYTLVVPVVTLSIMAGLVSLILGLAARISKKEPQWQVLDSQFHIAIALCVISGLIDLYIQIFAPASWKGPFAATIQALTIAVCGAALLFSSRGKRTLCLVVEKSVRQIHQSAFWKHYRTFLLLLMSFSVIADLKLHYDWLPGSYARESQAAAPQKTNVMLLVLDTVAAKHTSVYNESSRATPFLAELASKSLVFERLISTSSWTLPSHASLFTGLLPGEHGAHLAHQKLENSFETLAEIFSARGYQTAGFIANPRVKAKVGLAQGFDIYRDRVDLIPYRPFLHLKSWHLEILSPFTRIDNEKVASEVSAELKSWLVSGDRKPFFAFLNFIDAHLPYNLGAEYYGEFGVSAEQVASANRFALLRIGNAAERLQAYNPDPTLRSGLLGGYLSELRSLDAELEKLFTFLEQGGFLKDTIVVILSDHGEEFFEHGGIDHLITLNQEMLHVPLLIYAPWLFKPARLNESLSIKDLFFFLDGIIGHEPSRDPEWQAQLLKSLGAGQNKPIFAERFAREGLETVAMQAVVLDKWKRIRALPEFGRLESGLFDLSSDPEEMQDLSSQELELVREMDSLLDGTLKSRALSD